MPTPQPRTGQCQRTRCAVNCWHELGIPASLRFAPDIDPAFGNGFPQGAHDYLLNIIGVPKDKTADMDDNNGHRIFVQLNGGETVTNPGGKWKTGQSFDDLDKVNKILLLPGDYGVLDANATDRDGAIFQLPDPCDDADPTTECTPSYSV